MSLIHATPAVTPFRRVDSTAARRRHVDSATAIGAAVFLIVLIADALLIAAAAPSVAALGLLNVSSI
jgi:hypothetical protein